MRTTTIRLAQHRQPLIKFLGKRTSPAKQQPTPTEKPQPHPASPTHRLPESFASYRQKAIQHGPLGPRKDAQPPPSGGSISYGKPGVGLGGKSGHSLGSIQPSQGQLFDRSELPRRFQVTTWSAEEIEAVESGGASLW